MANDNDLFAPPTREELFEQTVDDDLYAPPPEGIEAAIPDEPSAAEALYGGAVTGATLGFREELAGAVGAPAYLYGKYGSVAEAFKHRGELPEEFRRIKAKETERAAREFEAQPTAAIAGELITGLALPAGGIKAAAKALKARGLAKRTKDLVRLEQLAKISKAAKLKGAAQLGGAGALTGLGVSEAELTKGTPEELKKATMDILTGGALGIAAPAALKKAGKGLKKFVDVKGLRKTAESKILASVKTPKRIMEEELLQKKDGLKGVGRALLGRVTDESGKSVPITSFIDKPDVMYENIGLALRQNRDKISPLFTEAQERINQVIPQLKAERIGEGLIGEELTDEVGDMLVKMGTNLRKQVGGGDKYNILLDKANDFVRINNVALEGYDLNQLGELKTALGKQLSETQWYKAIDSGQSIPEDKELITNIYFIVKKRIEDLADKVSKPGEKLGQEIKKLNGEYANLLDAKKIAKEDMLRVAKGPSLGYKDLILPSILGVSHGGPMGLAAAGTMYAIESKTGKKVGSLAQLATAKGLDKLAKVVEKAKTPRAEKIANELKELVGLPIVERSGRLGQILSANEDLTGYKLSSQDSVQDKYTRLADSSNEFISSEPEQLIDIASRISAKSDGNNPYLPRLQKAIKETDPQRRNAVLSGLFQISDFRNLLKDISEEEQ